MNKHLQSIILKKTGATALIETDVIQSLWSGYGEIVRYGLIGSDVNSIVVKHVRLPKQVRHPRGWNSNLSHQRKISSYQIETAWYQQWNKLCNISCRTPKCLALETINDEVLILLEDLNASGYAERRTTVSIAEIKVCLSWLANFHASFIGTQPSNLWQTGTYWHLDTRPDELEALNDPALKQAARWIDLKLRNSPFQTFVHGDAKLANFCFSTDGKHVAAVDFQYVGGGCGMKDVAYFIGSCLNEDQCQQWETELLDHYFYTLKEALQAKHKALNVDAVERDWRALYPVAWTDFHRFLKGWSPDHWKINSYSEKLAREVLTQLEDTHPESP